MRVFAEAFPRMMTALMERSLALKQAAASIESLTDTSIDPSEIKARCLQYADAASATTASMLEVFQMQALLLGSSLRALGLHPTTPTTRQ